MSIVLPKAVRIGLASIVASLFVCCFFASAQNDKSIPIPERKLIFSPGAWVIDVLFDEWGKPGPGNDGYRDSELTHADLRDREAIIPAGMQSYLYIDGDQSEQFASNDDLKEPGYSPPYDHDARIADSLKSISELNPLGVQYLTLSFVNARTNSMRLGRILSAMKNQNAFMGLSLGKSHIDSEDLKSLMEHPTFRVLELNRTTIEGSLFSAIAGHPGLEIVRLDRSGGGGFGEIAEPFLEGIETLPNLRRLYVRAAGQIGKRDMAAIGQAASLTTLTLIHCRETDKEAIMQLMPAKNIECLAISDRNIDELRGDPGLFDLFGKMPKLRDLDLSSTSANDGDIDKIIAIRGLRQIDLKDTQVTPAGIARLRAARPNLKVLYRDK